MAKQVIRNIGTIPLDITADAGYCSDQNLRDLSQLAVTSLIPPERVRHAVWRQNGMITDILDGLPPMEFARQVANLASRPFSGMVAGKRLSLNAWEMRISEQR
ncbi:MAG: hypothetical protein ACYCW6_14000 [Candidatus Xenobia bacterium]